MTAELAPVVVERLPAVPAAPVRNPYDVYLESLTSDESRRTMRGCLNQIARLAAEVDDRAWAAMPARERRAFGAHLRWEDLTYAHTSRIRATLIERGWSAAHVNKHLAALRRVLKEAWRLGLMDAEAYARAVDLEPVKGTRVPAGTDVPGESIAAVLAVCDADADSGDDIVAAIGARDGAILAVMYSTGCRRAEVVAFTLADYNPGDRSLRVHGKGNKERYVYLIPDAVARVERWLAVRGRAPGALFPGMRRGSHLRTDRAGHPAHMTPRALGGILDTRFTAARTARRTPHDFRRTYVGELLDAGADLATVQALAGHASPATTSRYDRRPERRRREATDKLRLPAARANRIEAQS
ncbi:tyrosine-type recombinase/integrase [Nonomuraea sp. NPDC023979]|uniref:tyrosine-type recombinase/integrase n=1 Tax=Nonomuraea sp. NPDC023979 TaxID=3154796 RepID=UPI0033F8C3B4